MPCVFENDQQQMRGVDQPEHILSIENALSSPRGKTAGVSRSFTRLEFRVWSFSERKLETRNSELITFYEVP